MYVRRSRATLPGVQLYRGIRDAIVSGTLAPHSRLPSTRDLATSEGVARNTALRVYEQLFVDGYLVRRRGAGNFVAGELPGNAATRLRADTDPATTPVLPPRLSRRGQRLAPLALVSWAPVTPKVDVDFRYGPTAFTDVPHQVWRRHLARAARETTPAHLDYGAPAGLPELRAAVAEYLTHARAVACQPEQIIIVHGSQQALALAGEVLLDPGDRVLIEEPGYPGAALSFWAAGATVIPGSVGLDGLDVRTLGKSIRRVHLAYVTPSHQFPTGVIMPLAQRLALLAWAERTGAFIFEDDYDSEFRFGVRPVESLQGLDPRARVIYAGTFSKVLFPSLRLGYLVVPEALVDPFRAAKALADTGTGDLEQRAMARFIRDGHFDRHLRRSRTHNAERRAALVEALDESVGEQVEVLGANAGLHVMLRLRDVPLVREAELIAAVEQEGVRVYSPVRFYLAPRQRPEAELILGYASLSPQQIRRGIERLAHVLGDFVRPPRVRRSMRT
ncbi:MAG TPA: PLP-dependent aminotransferase family protein [Candidatus Binatia bacterium]|jgi:GntR family transcriptional regulator/MocR family aminotransferase|nr:PLP-dependent aminotransferase family protein [Candidatus Binatia bacterium]